MCLWGFDLDTRTAGFTSEIRWSVAPPGTKTEVQSVAAGAAVKRCCGPGRVKRAKKEKWDVNISGGSTLTGFDGDGDVTQLGSDTPHRPTHRL